MYTYRHDQVNKSIYKFAAPNVQEDGSKRGQIEGWKISMEILITRADNKLRQNQWEHATSAYPSQYFPATQHTKDRSIAFFLRNHAPRGIDIDEVEYNSLHGEYHSIALAT